MALSIVNNVSSLNAQNNLARTNNNLSKSLERLSTGLKINRGADGPAGLVISEQQRAQISGLRAAIDNSNKSVALVQTAEGALNEVSTLLTRIRSLAVDSANTGVNDANALAANQSEIQNALSTIDRIGTNTQFGTRKLFDGNAGFSGTTADADVSVLKVTNAATPGTNAVVITTAGERAETIAANSTATIAQAETLNINGINFSFASGETKANIAAAINARSAETGVVATNNANVIELRTSAFGSNASISVTSNVAAATAGSIGFALTATTDTGVDIVGSIGGVSATGSGNVLTANGITVRLAEASAGSTATVTGAQGNVSVVDASLTFQIGANAGQTVNFAFDKVSADSLGVGVSGSAAASLAVIDVRSAAGAQDALAVIDQAINDVATLRGNLGAFQSNTLESNTNNLRAALENTQAAESVIRDTDFASEIAEFTRAQVQLQAGSSVLGNANQIPQLVAQLLRG